MRVLISGVAGIFLLNFFLIYHSLAQNLPVVGGIENVQIEPGEIILRAKLDTGADSTSLSAKDMEYFQKGKEMWVRFKLRSRDGVEKMMELLVLRSAKIKRESGRFEKRPVVRLGLCLGNLYMLVDANLTDRSEFAYPMLLGRDFIVGHLVIDASRSYLTRPECVIPGKKTKASKKAYEKKH